LIGPLDPRSAYVVTDAARTVWQLDGVAAHCRLADGFNLCAADGSAPPLPNGQPILRQGQPQFAPGAPRPGLLNRPTLNGPALPRPARQGPPPKDKKKK